MISIKFHFFLILFIDIILLLFSLLTTKTISSTRIRETLENQTSNEQFINISNRNLLSLNESQFEWLNLTYYQLPQNTLTYCHLCKGFQGYNILDEFYKSNLILSAILENKFSNENFFLTFRSSLLVDHICFVKKSLIYTNHFFFRIAFECNVRIIPVDIPKEFESHPSNYRHYLFYSFLKKHQKEYDKIILTNPYNTIFISSPFQNPFSSSIIIPNDCHPFSVSEIFSKEMLQLIEQKDFITWENRPFLNPDLIIGKMYSILQFYNEFLSSKYWKINLSDSIILNFMYYTNQFQYSRIVQDSHFISVKGCQFPVDSNDKPIFQNVNMILEYKRSCPLNRFIEKSCHNLIIYDSSAAYDQTCNSFS